MAREEAVAAEAVPVAEEALVDAVVLAEAEAVLAVLVALVPVPHEQKVNCFHRMPHLLEVPVNT